MDAAPDTRPESTVDAPTRWVGWFAALGGAVAWTAHLMLAYLISEFACVSGVGRGSFLGVSGVAWLIIALSVVMLGVAIAASVAGYSAMRDTAQLGGDPPQTIAGGRYLSRLGFLLSAFFALTILAESAPILWYLDDCRRSMP